MSQSAGEAFLEWIESHAVSLSMVASPTERLYRAFTDGWRAALAAQEQAHAEATRRIETALKEDG